MDHPEPAGRPDGQAAQPAAAEPKAKPASLLRNRDYLGWWTGNTVSALGTSISGIAFPLLVLFTTGSVAKAGLITAASMIGSVATTLWGGALADRVSRKAIMIIGPMIQAAALAVVALLAASGRTPILALAALACASGLARGFAAGAGTAALRRVVPKEQMATASSQMMGRDMAAEIIGSPLGGLLFTIARWIPFAGDAVSFLFASLGAVVIRRPLGPDRAAGPPQTSMIADIKAGLGFVRDQPFLRFVILWSSLVNIIGTGFFLMFIALVKYRGGGPTEIGLVSAVALIGGITGAVLAPLLLKRVRAKLVLFTTLWVFAGSFVGVALVPRPWMIGVALLFGMIGLAPINVVLEAYMIPLVPDALIARVGAVSSFGSQSLMWLGPLVAGLLAGWLGPPAGALALVGAFIPFAIVPHLTRSLDVLDQPLDSLTPLAVPGSSESPESAESPEPAGPPESPGSSDRAQAESARR